MKPLHTIHELNNRLIEEAYIVSKKREYVQHHIGEVDMEILNTHDEALPLVGFTKAMNILKSQQDAMKVTAQKNHNQQHPDNEDDDSMS